MKTNVNKLVAINSLNANRNIMEGIEKSSVLYLTLSRECERIMKRYPSLR